ncbi:MAG: hypothetical protein ACI4LA_10450 [Emergencia sp.]
MTAYTYFNRHYNDAVTLYKDKQYTAARIKLGRALHYINDIAMPHHAMNKVVGLSRHSQFENYVEGRYTNYGVSGISSSVLSPYATRSTKTIADQTAEISRNNYTKANSTSTSDMNSAATTMMERAQRDAAGVIYKFYKEVGKI